MTKQTIRVIFQNEAGSPIGERTLSVEAENETEAMTKAEEALRGGDIEVEIAD